MTTPTPYDQHASGLVLPREKPKPRHTFMFECYRFQDVPKFLKLLDDTPGAAFISASHLVAVAFGCESGYVVVYVHTEELAMEALT
jgi:hypothetical protein